MEERTKRWKDEEVKEGFSLTNMELMRVEKVARVAVFKCNVERERGRKGGRGRKKEGRENNIRMTRKDFVDGAPYFFLRSQALFSICHDRRTFRPLRFTSLIVCSKMDITNYFFKKISTFFILFKMLSYLIIISIKSEIFILGQSYEPVSII